MLGISTYRREGKEEGSDEREIELGCFLNKGLLPSHADVWSWDGPSDSSRDVPVTRPLCPLPFSSLDEVALERECELGPVY